MPTRQSSRKRKNGGGNMCTGARKKTLAQLMEEEAVLILKYIKGILNEYTYKRCE